MKVLSAAGNIFSSMIHLFFHGGFHTKIGSRQKTCIYLNFDQVAETKVADASRSRRRRSGVK
jgi:hypothetical protein